jgi:hypothetical protein
VAYGIAELLGGMMGVCVLSLFVVPVTAIVAIIYYRRNPPA